MNDTLPHARRRLLVGFLLALATFVFARGASAAMPPLADQAIKSLDSVDPDAWSFTMTTLEAGKKTIEHFDPSKPAGSRWQLLLKNGATPTTGELDDYRKEKAKQDERGKDRDRNPVRKSIDETSVTLLSETTDRAVYAFRVKADKADAKEIAEKLRGTLTVSKAQPYVESMELTSAGEISPMVSVKISEMYMKMSFRRDAGHDAVLLTGIRSRVRGRAMFVKSLDADVEVTVSDYVFVGKTTR